MIEIPRALARQFRALLRRCSASRILRGPGPLVLIRAGPHGLSLRSCVDEAALCCHLAGPRPNDELAFSAEVLARIEGGRNNTVQLERLEGTRGRARWQEGQVPRTEEFEVLLPDATPAFPAMPTRFVPQPVSLLTALVEAARAAASQPSRFALSHVQLAGKSGEVVGTDGKQLLIQGGFELPWSESLLVPALPALAAPELSEGKQLTLGRTDSHVTLVNGPWALLLAIDTSSRFPDYRAVIPAVEPGMSVLEVEPGDVNFLRETIPRLPGEDQDHSAITLDLGKQAVLRVSHAGQVTEVVLSRSKARGRQVCLAMDRCYLIRALKLGFNRVQVVARNRPVVCQDEKRTYLWMPLDGPVVPPSPEAQRLVSAALVANNTPLADRPPSPRRRQPMPDPKPPPERPPRNGAAPSPAPAATHEPGEPMGLEDLISEAEGLRSTLGEAYARLGRLLVVLKQHRRHARAVESALASLRQLPPSPWRRTPRE